MNVAVVGCNKVGSGVNAEIPLALGLSDRSGPALMRDGKITARCEAGDGTDAGTFRLTCLRAGWDRTSTIDPARTLLAGTSFDAPSLLRYPPKTGVKRIRAIIVGQKDR